LDYSRGSEHSTHATTRDWVAASRSGRGFGFRGSSFIHRGLGRSTTREVLASSSLTGGNVLAASSEPQRPASEDRSGAGLGLAAGGPVASNTGTGSSQWSPLQERDWSPGQSVDRGRQAGVDCLLAALDVEGASITACDHREGASLGPGAAMSALVAAESMSGPSGASAAKAIGGVASELAACSTERVAAAAAHEVTSPVAVQDSLGVEPSCSPPPSVGASIGDQWKIRPHRKGPYVHRTRVYIRVDSRVLEKLDHFAGSLKISRAHLCDVALDVAMGVGRAAEGVRRQIALLAGVHLPQRPIIVVMFVFP